MNMIWFAYLLAYSVSGTPFVSPTTPGAEARILVDGMGPHGMTKAECLMYANNQRQQATVKYNLPERSMLSVMCVQQPVYLPTKAAP